jgi:hypothetical protein
MYIIPYIIKHDGLCVEMDEFLIGNVFSVAKLLPIIYVHNVDYNLIEQMDVLQYGIKAVFDGFWTPHRLNCCT